MTTKQAQTPGPWKYQKPRGHQHAIDRKYEVIAPLNGGEEIVIVGEHTGVDCLKESDARLIAAAPDLLAALTQMVRYDDLPTAEQQPAVERARAAIAKAKGEA